MLSPSASSASSRRNSPIPSTAQSLVPSSSADSDRFNRRVATVSMSFSTSPVGDGDHRLRQRSFDGSQLTFSSPSRFVLRSPTEYMLFFVTYTIRLRSRTHQLSFPLNLRIQEDADQKLQEVGIFV